MATREQSPAEQADLPPGWPSPEERPDLPPPAKGGWEILGGFPRTKEGVLFTKWIDRLLRIKPKPDCQEMAVEHQATQGPDVRLESERGAARDAIEVPPPGPGYHVTDGYPHRETDPKNWRRFDGEPAEYPPPGRVVRVKESAPGAPPLPRIHAGTYPEEGKMSDQTPAADAHDEDAPRESQSDHAEHPKFPPPGPPVLVSDNGVGIQRKRREAREAWEREYGSGRNGA